MGNDFDGEERRRHSRTISEVEDAFERKLMDHETREREFIEKRFSSFAEEAFPDGTITHRLAHQVMIDAARAQTEFWQTLKTEIITKSIWGILRILLILLVAGLVAKFGVAPIYLAWLTK